MIGLIILDGWGISNCKKYNAIEQANIQNFRRLLEIYPNTALRANGLDVGLPEGQMGNSSGAFEYWCRQDSLSRFN